MIVFANYLLRSYCIVLAIAMFAGRLPTSADVMALLVLAAIGILADLRNALAFT